MQAIDESFWPVIVWSNDSSLSPKKVLLVGPKKIKNAKTFTGRPKWKNENEKTFQKIENAKTFTGRVKKIENEKFLLVMRPVRWPDRYQ